MRRLAPLLFLALAAAAPGEERDYLLTNFDRLRVDGPYDVHVVTGGATGAHATGDARALERLTLRNDGGTLVVTVGNANWDGWRGAAEGMARVDLSVPALHAALINGGGRLSIDRMAGQRVDLGVNGAGVLKVDAIDADQLMATLTGTGAMTLGGKALRATFGSYGAGSVDAGGLVANDLVVRASSAGDARFAARYTATVSAIGVGAVTVTGTPKCTVSGSGPVFCGDNVERRR